VRDERKDKHERACGTRISGDTRPDDGARRGPAGDASPAVDIYSGPLLALTDGLLRDIARVFNTTGRAYIYISNGHGAWEASLTNVLSKGDKILVLESGRFAIGWGESARRMGVEVEILKGDMRRAVRPAEVEARLKADSKGGRTTIKAILVGADRHRLGRGQRHRGDRPGDSRRRPRRAADGRCRGLARLHAVRDGQVGRRRRHVGLAEGHDDAAGPGLRRRQRRAREVTRRPACARPTGTGPTARATCTTRNTPARRPSICCSACARRSTCCSRRARERVPRHSAAGRGGAPRGRRVGEGQAIGFNIIEPASAPIR
jgi:hypothetical protein